MSSGPAWFFDAPDQGADLKVSYPRMAVHVSKQLPIDKFKIQAGFDALGGVCAAIYLSVRKAKRNPRLPIVAGAMASVGAVIDDYARRQSRHSENPET
mgnify:FL=1